MRGYIKLAKHLLIEHGARIIELLELDNITAVEDLGTGNCIISGDSPHFTADGKEHEPIMLVTEYDEDGKASKVKLDSCKPIV